MKARIAIALLSLVAMTAVEVRASEIVVGSKAFAENYILAEIAAQLLEANGFDVDRKFGMNGTQIVFGALDTGAIDVYPEYSGTITEVILRSPEISEFDEIRAALEQQGLILLPPLGFDNAYGIAVLESFAEQHQLSAISDLKRLDAPTIAVPHEFLNRSDGWPGLKAAYELPFTASGIEHALAFEAIASNEIQVTAIYTTDGEIARTGLRVLADDRGYFPRYQAAYFGHHNLDPIARELLASLSGRISVERMQAMNLTSLDTSASFAEIASAFLLAEGLVDESVQGPGFAREVTRNVQRHLKLTGIALLLAILFGVGIAVVVHRHRLASSLFLQFTGLLQTVPSIALLALLIPLVGVGETPAIIALFLYSLLPIARNTITAIQAIPAGYRQVAAAMAMTRRQELRYVLLPLAMPHLLAGVRTAAIICIGTATLAAFIGAGGLGDPIVTGLALNDTGLILQGAIPAALLAIVTELAFGGIERVLVPAHMRSGQR